MNRPVCFGLARMLRNFLNLPKRPQGPWGKYVSPVVDQWVLQERKFPVPEGLISVEIDSPCPRFSPWRCPRRCWTSATPGWQCPPRICDSSGHRLPDMYSGVSFIMREPSTAWIPFNFQLKNHPKTGTLEKKKAQFTRRLNRGYKTGSSRAGTFLGRNQKHAGAGLAKFGPACRRKLFHCFVPWPNSTNQNAALLNQISIL